MPRHQRGSLRKERRSAGETWVLRYFVQKPDGRRVENTRVIGLVCDLPGKSAAWDEVDAQHLHQEINQPVFRGKLTFGDLAAHYKKNELGDQTDAQKPKAYTTILRNKSILANHLVPRWGVETAAAVEPLEIERWLRSLRNEKKLANPTLHKIR